MIQLDLGEFVLFNVYFPNGQMSEERLRYKLDFYEASLLHFEALKKTGRPVVVMGDFNTAHKEIDLKNPDGNKDRSGFLPVEREWLDRLVASGFVDTFRLFNQEADQYTWWTYRFRAREKNIGWRIDYFFVSEDLVPNVKAAWIRSDVLGSDHCPVGLTLRFAG
jgi:exodeoxyribonuclease-3